VVYLNPRTLLLVLRNLIGRRHPSLAYFSAILMQVNPGVVLTYIDNSSLFHETAASFPSIPFIAVQNGNRFPYVESVLPALREYSTIMLLWSKFELESYHAQNTRFRQEIVCGSLKSESCWSEERHLLARVNARFDICFIGGAFCQDQGVIWFEENAILARWLRDFLQLNSQATACVALRTGAQAGDIHLREVEFYSALFGDRAHLAPRVDDSSSYIASDYSHVTLSSGSSVSIESLGRGNRSLVCHPIYAPSGPLQVVAPFILNSSDPEEFSAALMAFLDMTDFEFSTQFGVEIGYHCHSVLRADATSAILSYVLAGGPHELDY
jgi:surface carbohydrate biosynthesis protein